MNMHQTFAPKAEQTNGDCITIIARSPGQAIAEFHKRGLNKEGYAICGQVVPHKFELISDEGDSQSLFDGDHFYSATFVRRAR